MNKNPMKKIKQLLTSIASALIVIALFAIIFIVFDIVEPTPQFFLELGLVLGLTLCMKIMWYDSTEEKILLSDEITTEKKNYFELVDERIEDVNDLEKYLVILNQENRDYFIKNYIGSRTVKNLSVKSKWLCFWHPSYRKLTPDEIGAERYAKIYFKAQRKADKIKPITSEELMALAESSLLYDSKNHSKEKKRMFQISTTLFSFVLTTGISLIAVKELSTSWNSIFRFIGYLCAMVWTVAYTIIVASRNTRNETLGQLDRLKLIIDKYATQKNKEEESNGDMDRTCFGLCDTTKRT